MCLSSKSGDDTPKLVSRSLLYREDHGYITEPHDYDTTSTTSSEPVDISEPAPNSHHFRQHHTPENFLYHVENLKAAMSSEKKQRCQPLACRKHICRASNLLPVGNTFVELPTSLKLSNLPSGPVDEHLSTKHDHFSPFLCRPSTLNTATLGMSHACRHDGTTRSADYAHNKIESLKKAWKKKVRRGGGVHIQSGEMYLDGLRYAVAAVNGAV